ncbi:hypothetical protein ILUMI_05434 [Ignelater luminosus]|uniref:F-box domain-containing protein n=1 Tax=Ignelater luminosus TaxID=2038154 RepID=A0A8K0GDK4_IGNLU|nr:hypothetical protein ILUMI_05434 [Ignelater luminosus]
MITSTTELLIEAVGESGLPTGPGTRLFPRTSQLSEVSVKMRKEFAVHYDCIQSWFLRSSWTEKIESLTLMLKGLNNVDCLSLVLNTLMISSSKPTVYAESQYFTNFVYDKALHDHNRSLHPQTFTETRDADIEWYKTLEDSEQVLILIGLIRLGGGSVVHQIYERGVKIYNERAKDDKKIIKPVDIIEIKAATPTHTKSEYNEMQMRKDVERSSSFTYQLPVTPRVLNIKPAHMMEFEKCNPKDPYVMAVEKKRKTWNETINKYKIQVEGRPLKDTSKGKKGDKSTKTSKSSKSPSKSPKSSKTGKGSKSDKKKIDVSETVDQIQLLPVWIVKKIFSYLDAKTLKKIKSVNKYWAYAVTDLQKEQKARKTLDKFIRKMEESIDLSCVQIDATEKTHEPPKKAISPKKRLLELSKRGTTLPKLTGKLKRPLDNKSIAAEAAMQLADNYILPVSNLESFPRNMARAAPLYKVRSCMINEMGFNKTWFDETLEFSIVGTFVSQTTLRFPSRAEEPIVIKEEMESKTLS